MKNKINMGKKSDRLGRLAEKNNETRGGKRQTTYFL